MPMRQVAWLLLLVLSCVLSLIAVIDDPFGQSLFPSADPFLDLPPHLTDLVPSSLAAQYGLPNWLVQRGARAAGWALRKYVWLVSWWRLPPANARVLINPEHGVVEHGCPVSIDGGAIELRWDENGVAHVLADDLNSAVLGQGFAMARDRLFQLEFLRRAARADTHKLFGEKTVALDRILFDLQFEQLARDQLARNKAEHDDKWLACVSCFLAGVNAYLRSPQYRAPAELLFAEAADIPLFDHVDLYAVNLFTGWIMSRGGEHEVVRGVKVQSGASEEHLREVTGLDLIDSFVHVHLPGGGELNDLLPFLAGDGKEKLVDNVPFEIGGSNAWAVAGWRTKSGRPILANDPHLMSTNPNSWYLMHLTSRDGLLNAAGASFVGSPLIMTGHNQRFAWGATLSYIDCIDYFIEQVRGIDGDSDGDDQHQPPQYLFKEEWLPLKVSKKTATLANGKTVQLTSYATHHGPLVSVSSRERGASQSHIFGAGKALAMASTIHSLPRKFFSDDLLLINTGTNWHDWSRALRAMQVPISSPYADVDGNIGYGLSGTVPVRPGKGGPSVPLPGWTGEHDWQGYLPDEQKPFTLNPANGYVIVTNNRIVAPDDFEHYISDVYASTGSTRAARAAELLTKNDAVKLDVVDHWNMQLDMHSIPAANANPLLCNVLKTIDTPAVQTLLPVLAAWNGEMDKFSAAPTVFHTIVNEFLTALLDSAFGLHFGDATGNGPTASQLIRGKHILQGVRPTTEYAARDLFLFRRLLEQAIANNSSLIRDHGGLETLLAEAAESALAWLRAHLGQQPGDWQWGRVHTQTWQHPMGRTFPGSSIFNLGPVAVDGDETTLCSTGRLSMYGADAFVPSLRLVWDLADWENSYQLSPPGQSGNMASSYHSNMLLNYQRSLGVRPYWSDQAVRNSTIATWTLLISKQANNEKLL